ncbi:hypothetical protein MTP06_48790 [Streptomyces sp. PLM4]|uniref:Uncharacterized protein n=1 Tax=Streptomyces albidoflavus TaxID=1886 RepID=A0AA37FAT4_9ACTN|nr:hypothetical protein MTP06_48790 [Streptomyces sp. PLM4]GHI45260.1 hypothetical protein ScoT_14340 [Streptomyces albidoflavus]
MSANTGSAPAATTAPATSARPKAGTTTSSPRPIPAALSIFSVPMPHMLAADGEREVTENKKVVVPGPKSGDHHSE